MQTLTAPPRNEFEHPSNYMLAIMTGITGSVGLPGNLLLLSIISKNIKSGKPFEWLLFNLAVNDTIMCFNSAILQSVFVLNYENVGCKVAGFIQYLTGCMSFTVPPTVAYNRYLSMYNVALCKTVFIPRNVVIICLFTWLVNFGFFCPALVTGNLGLDDLGICGIRQTTPLLQLMMAFACMCIFLSYVISFYCGYKVITKIRDHKAGLVSNIQSSIVLESRELVILFSILLAIPLFFSMPAVCIKFIQIIFLVDPWISRTFTSTYTLASAVNPYLTLWVVKDYRKHVKKIIFPSNSTLVQSIQTGNNI